MSETIDLTPSAKEEILKMASQGLQMPHVTHPQYPSRTFHLVTFFHSCAKQCFGSKQRGGQRPRCRRHSGRQTECSANHSPSHEAGTVVRLVYLIKDFPLCCFVDLTHPHQRFASTSGSFSFLLSHFPAIPPQLPPSLSSSSRFFRSFFIIVSVAASAFASTALIALAPGPLIIV